MGVGHRFLTANDFFFFVKQPNAAFEGKLASELDPTFIDILNIAVDICSFQWPENACYFLLAFLSKSREADEAFHGRNTCADSYIVCSESPHGFAIACDAQ